MNKKTASIFIVGSIIVITCIPAQSRREIEPTSDNTKSDILDKSKNLPPAPSELYAKELAQIQELKNKYLELINMNYKNHHNYLLEAKKTSEKDYNDQALVLHHKIEEIKKEKGTDDAIAFLNLTIQNLQNEIEKLGYKHVSTIKPKSDKKFKSPDQKSKKIILPSIDSGLTYDRTNAYTVNDIPKNINENINIMMRKLENEDINRMYQYQRELPPITKYGIQKAIDYLKKLISYEEKINADYRSYYENQESKINISQARKLSAQLEATLKERASL